MFWPTFYPERCLIRKWNENSLGCGKRLLPERSAGLSKILVIDDNELVREMVSATLDTAGHEVRHAADGEEGLRIQDEYQADVVVTDMVMPVLDGVETIRRMKRMSPPPAIIAISGSGHLGADSHLRLARQCGADAILPKPVQRQALLAAVQQILATRESFT